jgi:hypothetical protein
MTVWGRAVCTEVHDRWIAFRYRATRFSDQKEIWVANGDDIPNVTFLRKPTRFTARILLLRGPYGEG